MTKPDPDAPHARGGGWPLPFKIAFAGFLAIGAFFLWTEHRAHLLGYWPFSFLLACVVMHVFMHHGSHDDSDPMTTMASSKR